MRRLWLIVVVLTSLVGCASSNLAPERRAEIKRVAIADVQMPEKPKIFGEKAAVAFLLGGPLGIALADAGSDLPTLYAKQLQENGIDVASMVKSDLSRLLSQQGFQVVPQAQPADAVLVPVVMQYGLTGDIFASPPVRVPQLWLRIDLKKPSTGERIWWNDAAVHVMPDVMRQLEAKRIDEYLQDGEQLRRQVEKASKLITQAVMSKL